MKYAGGSCVPNVFMERSNSAFITSKSGEGFSWESGVAAARRGTPGKATPVTNRIERDKYERRRRVALVCWFKGASLRIRRNRQVFSVRHRLPRDKAQVAPGVAAEGVSG